MSGASEGLLAVTFFKSFGASWKTEKSVTLDALSNEIRTTTAESKAALPWLKLARFGDIRTDKHSLRHDANVLAISGIEVDYDDEKIQVDDAVERLTKAGLLSIIYTSPSHSDAKPRWRVLCPTSQELPPERRKHLVGRINGLFNGTLAAESWTLSQSYYLGSVNRNPAHRVEIIDGAYIDALDELDKVWRGPPDTQQSTGTRIGPLDEPALVQAIIDGKSYHEAAVRLLGRWAVNGVSFMEARRRLTDAMETVFPADRDTRWTARMADVDRCLQDIYGKEARKRDAQAEQLPPPPDDIPPPDEHDNGRETSDIEQHDTGGPIPGLADFLDITTWAQRDIPEPDRLLGDVVTTDTRWFVVGSTGLGKTMFGLALAQGMASGLGFLHWRSVRPARVLYIDGEMSAGLIKARSASELGRSPAQSEAGKLMIYSVDYAEQTSQSFAGLTQMPPLNSDDGHQFIRNLLRALGPVDVVIFDNVMSLLAGDMKDEETWSGALPLVGWLSSKRIGQVWIDHTGHNSARQYGSSTKAWRFDAVAIMTSLPEDQRRQDELAFQLSFNPPGKARRRTPANWQDFAPTIVRLADDRWTGEVTEAGRSAAPQVSPAALAMHRALLDALAVSDIPGETTRDAWHAEGARLGLLDALRDEDNRAARDRKRARLRKHLTELKVAGWIGVDGETVRNLNKAAA